MEQACCVHPSSALSGASTKNKALLSGKKEKRGKKKETVTSPCSQSGTTTPKRSEEREVITKELLSTKDKRKKMDLAKNKQTRGKRELLCPISIQICFSS